MTQRRLPLFASLFLLTIMFVVLAAGFGLVLAQEEGPVPGARPTPTPDGSLPSLVSPEGPESPAAPEIPPLPDLVVESIEVVPASPVIGQEVIIRVTIKNQGTVDVTPGNNFWSDLYIDPAEVPISLGQDGEAEWPCQSTWVPAGGSYILVTTHTFDDVKTYSLWAQVDTDNHVQEANENNNVRGPVSVEVLARDKIVHETHQEFQLGMASSLDLSHPEGVIRLGIFREPTTEPEVYAPDTQIDHPPEPPSGPTAVNQTYPALASDGADTLFAVWEDGRNGGVFNRDIYFSRRIGDDTWQPDIRVNQAGTGNQIRPDLVYDPDGGALGFGRLYAVWQDERSGNYDIYFAYSDNAGNPETALFACTDGGGVFKTTDGGANWSAANTGLTSMSVMDLAIDPLAPVTIYAGTDGGGVFTSTNGGASWSPANTGLTSMSVMALAIDPVLTATLYAGTDVGGVFKTTDGGANWSAANTGLTSMSVMDLAIDPLAPATIYAGTDGGGVFKTTNGGASWNPANTGLTSMSVMALAIDPLAPATIYAGTDGGGVFKTTNGGASWNPANTDLTSMSVMDLAIDPFAPATIYAGTDGGGVFKTTDGGESWSAVNTGLTSMSVMALTIDPMAPAMIYAGTDGGGVFKTKDGGESWSAVNTGLTSLVVRALRVDSLWTQYPQPLNDDVGSAAQLNPSIALGPDGEVYVVWQDQRNGNDDVYLTRSDNGGETWSANYFVTDDPEMTAQNQVAPSVIVENMEGRVIVSWEDWRDPLHPEIYTMWSKDRGATFGIDVPITIVAPEARDTYRRAPTLATETTLETIIYTYTTPVYPGLILTDTEVTSMTVIHLAWEEWLDGREDQADVYYTHANYIFNRELRETCPYPYQDEDDFCFKAPQRISGHFMDSAYVRPPGDSPQWPVEPSWQGQVSMALVPAGVHTTYCHADSTEDYSRGVVLAWADARSFDEWRYEIHTRRIASPVDNPEVFEPCEDWAWGMVNDNAKIYALRDDPDLYEKYKPAATGQFNPAVLVDPDKVIVAWDDDRYDDPTKPGTVRNRDVFMAEMDRNMEGIFISPVLDGRKADPKWYVLSWWGVTEHSSDVLFQTRFGDKDYPNPPQVGTSSDGWTAWTGNPSSTYLGCLAGEGCYYDAPGRHIVRPDGTDWFTDPNGTQYRYMQYKIIMNGQSRLTAVSQVTIHYEGAGRLYLPMILRNQ